MITNAALKNGFTGGLIVDFPNSRKAKKFFLFLMAGYSDEIQADAEKAIMLPKARTDGEDYSDISGDEDDESGEDESMGSSSGQEQEESSDGSLDDGPKIGVAKNKNSRL